MITIQTIPRSSSATLLVDSGAALHVCHFAFFEDYPLMPLESGLLDLQLEMLMLHR